MEENTDNMEGLRVTRARTRRMSLLDTDSRPETPLLDTASDRGTASPRPTRRTRLNSVTLDVRTPTRPTRASLARGETPEPGTPSSVKRTARTPAKSRTIRQELTLKEEEAEDIEVKLVEKPSSRTSTPTPTGDKRVTRSMSQTPPSVTQPSSLADLKPSPEAKQNLEPEIEDKPKELEKVKTHSHKVAVRLEKMKMSEQRDNGVVFAKDIEQKARESPINPLEVDESNDDDPKKSAEVQQDNQASIPISEPKTVPDPSEPSEKTTELQAPAAVQVRPLETDESLEEEEFLEANESLPVDEPQTDERVSDLQQDSKDEQQAMPKPDIAEPEKDIPLSETQEREEPIIEVQKLDIIAEPEEEIKPPEIPVDADVVIPMDEDQEIRVPNVEKPENIHSQELSTGPNSRSEQQKKFVGFNSDTEEADIEKKRFPKTPGREKGPSSFNFTPNPVKADVEQRRNSSTPILKNQEQDLTLGKTELQPPPLQIDAIKPFDELEKEEDTEMLQPANMSQTKAVNKILVLLDSDEEPEEKEGEEEFIDNEAEPEGDESMCEFIDDYAEVAPPNYQSGDSMDSSERREIEENEIHCDGESVGSQDTEDEYTGDSNMSNDSFVVSDDDVEEDLDPLCYSTNEEDEVENVESKDTKKRRRIVVAESSEDENHGKDEEKSQMAKSKDQSNCSSDASKLSEAAQMMNGSAEKSSTSETELGNSRAMALNELNRSERFNKTATLLDASVLELDSTDHKDEDEDGEEEEDDHAEKGNKSVYEIIDSEDDKGTVGEYEVAEAETKKTDEEETVGKSTSFQAQKSSKSADEEALLAELASSDLRHLETMFNPLQKSRRQSLIMPGHELTAKEPKLKRRSDRALGGSDFCPSQSFVEMLAEQKRVKNKRKRLSKSFSGAAEDLEEMGGIHHERKRLKSCRGESTESLEDDDRHQAEAAFVEPSAEMETPGPDALQESDSVEEALQAETIQEATPEKEEEAKKVIENISLKKSPAKSTSLDNAQPEEQYKATQEENKMVPSIKTSTSKARTKEPKTAKYYLEYCNTMLQKVNEAVLKKKKEDIAAGKKQKKTNRPAAPTTAKSKQAIQLPTVQAEKQVIKPQPPPKKDLKRLQAARQAVGHAVSLLAPTKIASTEPRSLARKLSPQPPIKAKKETKKEKKFKAQKLPETSPLKSSDEENHGVGSNRFRTNAGFVTVSRIDSPPRERIIELIKTSSGIMRVEPVTPKRKYFRESPATPKNHGFQERPASPGPSKKRAKQKALQAEASGKQNSAMQSALRFKEQAFARKF